VHGASAEALALVLLALSLAVAVIRPFGVTEALVALPAAGVLVATGAVPWPDAAERIGQIGPTVGFLAAILVVGRLCADEGVFDYLGALATRAGRRPTRLLTVVVMLAAAVTALLTLDATVVLLTPAVLAATRRLGTDPRPHAYACVRLANSGSLLLPVSNLTNLLAFSAASISFERFTALMALPWLAVCAAEWLGLRIGMRARLRPGDRRDYPAPAAPPRPPGVALALLVLTVSGVLAATSLAVPPAWPAAGGALLLLGHRRLRGGPLPLRRTLAATSPGFCVFVLALAVVVEAAARHGLGALLAHAVPSGSALPELLAIAAVAALLANLVNNLPATLILIPLVTGTPGAVLAMLIGVNIGPHATYPGSLATLLWRRIVPASERPGARTFHLAGLLGTPVLLVLATLALWVGLRG
jgi:arsenical pump membrane protein